MPAWIECRDCGVEFRDKPGRTKCPECGTRIPVGRGDDREEEEWDDERPRRKSKGVAAKGGNGLLFALIGVGVLAVGLVVVLILLLGGGPKRDPSKVTVANFQQLNLGMTQRDAEKVLAGSSSSSFSDMQTEVSNAFGMQGWTAGLTAQFSSLGGSGSWRRWDGPNSDLRVWALFAEPLGGGRETLTFCTAIEKMSGGGFRHHQGKQSLGGIFGGFPFPQGGFPGGGAPFPGGGQPPFPQFPFPK